MDHLGLGPNNDNTNDDEINNNSSNSSSSNSNSSSKIYLVYITFSFGARKRLHKITKIFVCVFGLRPYYIKAITTHFN